MAKQTTSEQPEKVPSSFSLWIEEALPGWVIPVVVVLLTVGIAALYIFDLLPERFTALVLAIGVSVVISGYVARTLLGSAKDTIQRLVCMGTVVMVFVLTLGPVLFTIMPGEPLASGIFKAAGEKIKLPSNTNGRVRLLVHGRIGGAGESAVEFEIKGTQKSIVSKIERTTSTARAGRRGYATVSHEHNSEFLSAVIPSGTTELTLENLTGPLLGELEINIFRERWPALYDAIFALVVLAMVAIITARQKSKSSASAIAGIALCYGLMVQVLATPDVAVRAQIGALIRSKVTFTL